MRLVNSSTNARPHSREFGTQDSGAGISFIVGYPRSGTTLLASFLDRHSRVAVPPETSVFLPHLAPNIRAYCESGGRQYVQSIHDLLDSLQLPRDLLESCPPKTIGQFIDRILVAYARSRNKLFCVEKSPWHVLYFEQLFRCFPNTRVICIIRDGRDAIQSVLKTDFGRDQSWKWHALNWNRAARKVIAAKHRFDHQILMVKFEDLVAHPESELNRICKFLHLKPEPQQLDPSVPTGVVLPFETWKQNIHCQVDSSRAFAWRNTLQPPMLWKMNAVMRKYLKEFGYEDYGQMGYGHKKYVNQFVFPSFVSVQKSAEGAAYRAKQLLTVWGR